MSTLMSNPQNPRVSLISSAEQTCRPSFHQMVYLSHPYEPPVQRIELRTVCTWNAQIFTVHELGFLKGSINPSYPSGKCVAFVPMPISWKPTWKSTLYKWTPELNISCLLRSRGVLKHMRHLPFGRGSKPLLAKHPSCPVVTHSSRGVCVNHGSHRSWWHLALARSSDRWALSGAPGVLGLRSSGVFHEAMRLEGWVWMGRGSQKLSLHPARSSIPRVFMSCLLCMVWWEKLL